MKKRYLFFLFFFSLLMTSLAQEKGYFNNPVIKGDLADPSIIRIKNTYYATGTSSEWAPFYPMFVSKDMVNWKQIGHVFAEKPAWTSNSFWAPELYYHNNKVYCYYTARQASSGISYIGVASADSPTRKFTDHGTIVEYGTEAIDAFIYNDDGQLYISWKAYGLDKRPIELLGSKLSADGLRLEGEPFTLLVDDENIGMEGQYQFKHGDYYYIVYAAHGCCGPHSDYDVYVARSKKLRGPYEKYAGNPILSKGNYQSVGHGTVVTTPDGRMFYLCHAYLKDEGVYTGRQPVLQEMYVDDNGWVQFRTGNLGQRKQALPFANTKQAGDEPFVDTFGKSKLKAEWSWNYTYSDAKIVIDKGKLSLAGTPKAGNEFGTVLCLRPSSASYSYRTKVDNVNVSLKGLSMYGDDKNLVLWGAKGDKLVLQSVKDGRSTMISQLQYNTSAPLYLQISVLQGRLLSFLWSQDNKNWTKVDTELLDAAFLVRWDRVSRPGLIHCGDLSSPALFDSFELAND